MMIIGVDTGGTFTDFVFKEGDRWGVYKSLSTPSNPAGAVLEGLRHIAGGEGKTGYPRIYCCHQCHSGGKGPSQAVLRGSRRGKGR